MTHDTRAREWVDALTKEICGYILENYQSLPYGAVSEIKAILEAGAEAQAAEISDLKAQVKAIGIESNNTVKLNWQKLTSATALIAELVEALEETTKIINASGIKSIYNWGAPLREIEVVTSNALTKHAAWVKGGE